VRLEELGEPGDAPEDEGAHPSRKPKPDKHRYGCKTTEWMPIVQLRDGCLGRERLSSCEGAVSDSPVCKVVHHGQVLPQMNICKGLMTARFRSRRMVDLTCSTKASSWIWGTAVESCNPAK